jgi:hypothetical protein
MKTVIMTIAAVLLLALGTGWAAEETDPVGQIAQYWEAEQAQREARQARLEELMSTLAGEMEAIRASTDAGKRQALISAHRENMHEAISLMRDMGGENFHAVLAEHVGTGAGGKHKHDMPSPPRKHMSDSARLSDLENRLDMTQILLESILAEQARY